MPKENMHYTCIVCITVDSVMRVEKKYFPQVCLEECKYKTKKNKNVKTYQHWTRFRFRVRFGVRWWINGKIKISFW